MGKTMQNFTEQTHTLGLYDPQFEHDACGIGAVVDIKGRKSHQTVDDALRIVERLEHRAGKDAEGKTGDGVGILLQISHKFFSKVADECNIRLGNEREYGVGMFFFPQNEHMRAQAMKLFEVVTRKEGLEFLAWRKVPVDPDAVGQKARDCMPSIWQCFIKKPAKVSKGIDFDRKLYVVRRVFEQASNGTYVPSLSSRTIVYKGMFLVHDLRRFYADLQDPDYESAIGMVHSRFSTNTNPSWMRAHPFCNNTATTEIYTIKVTGEIDISNADSLRNAIDLALEQPTEAVELDFAQVSYIDSTGIGVLVGAAHHAVDHGKRFGCVNVQPPVMRVVQLLGVDQEISITAA